MFWITATLLFIIGVAAVCSERSTRRGKILFCHILGWHRSDGPTKLVLGDVFKVCPRCGHIVELNARGRLHRG